MGGGVAGNEWNEQKYEDNGGENGAWKYSSLSLV